MGVGAEVVISLCKTTIKEPDRKVVLYFDNYFSSVPLFEYLLEQINIFSLGTIRPNRTGSCALESDRSLQKRGRGKYDYKSNGNVIITKWVDNKCVTGRSPISHCSISVPVVQEGGSSGLFRPPKSDNTATDRKKRSREARQD
ncbi:hypothetical protein ILUMI_17604 [Ignelater luminosus]|uniref:PiggyBac transposable element-derived protein domain-containing protein n=1 Tax=Ignelater luminosus TaxID=2038154 RepID=A0A8K0G752_IGNLU|nr:hypothetical protein ILUMI_17604 [Ignelater luminosus]